MKIKLFLTLSAFALTIPLMAMENPNKPIKGATVEEQNEIEINECFGLLIRGSSLSRDSLKDHFKTILSHIQEIKDRTPNYTSEQFTKLIFHFRGYVNRSSLDQNIKTYLLSQLEAIAPEKKQPDTKVPVSIKSTSKSNPELVEQNKSGSVYKVDCTQSIQAVYLILLAKNYTIMLDQDKNYRYKAFDEAEREKISKVPADKNWKIDLDENKMRHEKGNICHYQATLPSWFSTQKIDFKVERLNYRESQKSLEEPKISSMPVPEEKQPETKVPVNIKSIQEKPTINNNQAAIVIMDKPQNTSEPKISSKLAPEKEYPFMDVAMGVKFLHDKGLTGEGVNVGVIDSAGEKSVPKSKGFEGKLIEGTEPFDFRGGCHSSMVTGIICGQNITGRVATAPNVKVLFKGKGKFSTIDNLQIQCEITASKHWVFKEKTIEKGSIVTVTQPSLYNRKLTQTGLFQFPQIAPLHPEYAEKPLYVYQNQKLTIPENEEGLSLPVYGCTGYPYDLYKDPIPPLATPLYPGNLSHIKYMDTKIDESLSNTIKEISNQGIRIINFSQVAELYPKTLEALHEFAKKGGVFVMAAGNTGTKLSVTETYDNSQRFGPFEKRKELGRRTINSVEATLKMVADLVMGKGINENLNNAIQKALFELNALNLQSDDSESDPIEQVMTILEEYLRRILNMKWTKENRDSYVDLDFLDPARSKKIYPILVNPLNEYQIKRHDLIREDTEVPMLRKKLLQNHIATLVSELPKSIILVGNLKTVKEEQPYELHSSSTKAGNLHEHYIAAWGENIPSIKYGGKNNPETKKWGENKKIITEATGTSVAAPIIAGIIADLYQGFPQCTPLQIKDVLLKTASKKNLIGTPYDYGMGMGDARAAFEYLQANGCS